MASWACLTCTFLHEGPAAAFLQCEVCGAARGNAPSEADQQGVPVDLQGGESTEESDDEMPELENIVPANLPRATANMEPSDEAVDQMVEFTGGACPRDQAMALLYQYNNNIEQAVEAFFDGGAAIEPDPPPNPNDCSSSEEARQRFLEACRAGDAREVATMIEQGAQVDLVPDEIVEQGFHPLHAAVEHCKNDGILHVIDLLVNQGGLRVDALDGNQQTALSVAVLGTNQSGKERIIHEPERMQAVVMTLLALNATVDLSLYCAIYIVVRGSYVEWRWSLLERLCSKVVVQVPDRQPALQKLISDAQDLINGLQRQAHTAQLWRGSADDRPSILRPEPPVGSESSTNEAAQHLSKLWECVDEIVRLFGTGVVKGRQAAQLKAATRELFDFLQTGRLEDGANGLRDLRSLCFLNSDGASCVLPRMQEMIDQGGGPVPQEISSEALWEEINSDDVTCSTEILDLQSTKRAQYIEDTGARWLDQAVVHESTRAVMAAAEGWAARKLAVELERQNASVTIQAVLRSSLQLRDYEQRQCEVIWNDVGALIERMCLDETGSLKPSVLGWHLERSEQFLWEEDEIEEYGESELALQDGAGEDEGAPGEHDEAQMGPTEEEQELDSKQQLLRDQANAGEDIVALEAECEQLEMALLGNEETQAEDLSLDEQLAGLNPVVDLAKRALDWVHRCNKPNYTERFFKRLELMSKIEERSSYCLGKRLKTQCRVPIYECKLDKGMRILYQVRHSDTSAAMKLLVWDVVEHERISKAANAIAHVYQRLESVKLEDGSKQPNLDQPPEVALDPHGNTPQIVYRVPVDKLSNLSDPSWVPPVRLSEEEHRIVTGSEQELGGTLLHGRSGTGKTLCLTSRMKFIHDKFPLTHHRPPRQVFLARSKKLCNDVRSLLRNLDGDSETEAITVGDFLSKMELAAEGDHSEWAPERQADFDWFCKQVDGFETALGIRIAPQINWPKIKGLSKSLVWLQIRSFIQGSVEAVQNQGPITQQMYEDKAVFDVKRGCRIETTEERAAVYSIFEQYKALLEKDKRWDDATRVLALCNRVQDPDPTCTLLHWRAGEHAAPYDYIYADEIQDCTQSEMALMMYAVNCQSSQLFFAGDTAQAVTHGISFTFQQVKDVAYKLRASEKKIFENTRDLTRNYRSHQGVMRCANAVLQRLFWFYPLNDVLKPDYGIVLGPKPSLLQFNKANKREDVLRQLLAGGRVVVLTRDSNVEGLREEIEQLCGENESQTTVIGVQQAKGLEYEYVAVIDFFSSLDKHEKSRTTLVKKGWRSIANFRWEGDIGEGKKKRQEMADQCGVDSELEVELKLFYTAITRCRRKLFLSDSGEAGDAVLTRWLKEKAALVEEYKINDEAGFRAMQTDEWVSRGLQFASADELDEALRCFQNAGRTDLLNRARAQQKAQELLQAMGDELRTDADWRVLQRKAAAQVRDYVELGLLDLAQELCACVRRAAVSERQIAVSSAEEKIKQLAEMWNVL